MFSIDEVAVEGVLDPGGRVRRAPQAFGVGVVFGEQDRGRLATVEVIVAQRRMDGLHGPGRALRRIDTFQQRLHGIRVAPGPGVAEPQCRQQVQRRLFGSAVVGEDVGVDFVRRPLGVMHLYVPVAVLAEDAGVEQAAGRVEAAATAVFLDQARIGVFRLRIFVQIAQVAVARRGVEVEVILLDVLAVVALVAGEAEGAFLEDRIAAVPQRQREAQALLVVADAAHAVLVPAVGARARLVVVEIVPHRAVFAVVLAHRAPGPLREVGSPQAPVFAAFMLLLQALALRVQFRRCHIICCRKFRYFPFSPRPPTVAQTPASGSQTHASP